MTAPARFTKADLKRAVSGVVAAGLSIGKIEIDPATGKIVVLPVTGKEKHDAGEWADLE